MARKDLSRTVIEGGRYHRNRWERRASHGVARAGTRAWLDTVDHDEDDEAPPPLKPVAKSFYDKLAPAQRWLAAQVGRPWSKVYSELRGRFDSRTVAGRHVVEDHMLGWVRRHSREGLIWRYSQFELFVDEHGILRKPALFGRSYQAMRKAVVAWAAGRVCAHTHRGWWWWRRELLGDVCAVLTCNKHHFWAGDRRRYHRMQWRPVGPMDRGEVRYLEQLPDDMRRPLIIASPWQAP